MTDHLFIFFFSPLWIEKKVEKQKERVKMSFRKRGAIPIKRTKFITLWAPRRWSSGQLVIFIIKKGKKKKKLLKFGFSFNIWNSRVVPDQATFHPQTTYKVKNLKEFILFFLFSFEDDTNLLLGYNPPCYKKPVAESPPC
jgi:hypothetical protein